MRLQLSSLVMPLCPIRLVLLLELLLGLVLALRAAPKPILPTLSSPTRTYGVLVWLSSLVLALELLLVLVSTLLAAHAHPPYAIVSYQDIGSVGPSIGVNTVGSAYSHPPYAVFPQQDIGAFGPNIGVNAAGSAHAHPPYAVLPYQDTTDMSPAVLAVAGSLTGPVGAGVVVGAAGGGHAHPPHAVVLLDRGSPLHSIRTPEDGDPQLIRVVLVPTVLDRKVLKAETIEGGAPVVVDQGTCVVDRESVAGRGVHNGRTRCWRLIGGGF